MKQLHSIVALALTLAVLVPASTRAADGDATPSVLAAYQISNAVRETVWPEGNAQIMAAKEKLGLEDLGAMVYLYIRNPGPPAFLESISWGGSTVKEHAAAPDYQAIWWRLAPHLLGTNEEGEIAICLRRRLTAATEFTVCLTNGHTVTQPIGPDGPPFRFGTIAFGPDLNTVYLYVEQLRAEAPAPERIHVANIALAREPRWLSPGYVGGVRAAVIRTKTPLRRGRYCTFRVTSGTDSAGATVRAFTDLARFGSYGYNERLPDYAANGLSGYASFGSASKGMLDQAQQLGIKVAAHINNWPPADEVVGHPALYAHMGVDEPDCQDYNAKDRPMSFRVGATAMAMVRNAQLHADRDPFTPNLITVDLTFTPRNYFVYGPMPDIVNPDCYPIAIGWPVHAVRDKLTIAKRASAPRTMTYTYQNVWEEWSRRDTPAPWMGFQAIRDTADPLALVDLERRRGFGRAPSPEEIRLEILYGIGCGAKGFFGYCDGTELSRGGLFGHGTWVLPEIWQINGETIRALRLVAPLIQISHPVVWARAETDQVWMRTLMAADQAALVVATNEDYESVEAGFSHGPLRNVRMHFEHLPWLQAATVLRVGDGRFTALESQSGPDRLTWVEPELNVGELYLVLADAAAAAQLEERYRETAPFATEAGKTRPEDYLKGRRQTPRAPASE